MYRSFEDRPSGGGGMLIFVDGGKVVEIVMGTRVRGGEGIKK